MFIIHQETRPISAFNVSQKVLDIDNLNAKHTTWKPHQNNKTGHTPFDISKAIPVMIMHPNQFTHFPRNDSHSTR